MNRLVNIDKLMTIFRMLLKKIFLCRRQYPPGTTKDSYKVYTILSMTFKMNNSKIMVLTIFRI